MISVENNGPYPHNNPKELTDRVRNNFYPNKHITDIKWYTAMPYNDSFIHNETVFNEFDPETETDRYKVNPPEGLKEEVHRVIEYGIQAHYDAYYNRHKDKPWIFRDVSPTMRDTHGPHNHADVEIFDYPAVRACVVVRPFPEYRADAGDPCVYVTRPNEIDFGVSNTAERLSEHWPEVLDVVQKSWDGNLDWDDPELSQLCNRIGLDLGKIRP